jgi:hypothetical protein
LVKLQSSRKAQERGDAINLRKAKRLCFTIIFGCVAIQKEGIDFERFINSDKVGSQSSICAGVHFLRRTSETRQFPSTITPSYSSHKSHGRPISNARVQLLRHPGHLDKRTEHVPKSGGDFEAGQVRLSRKSPSSKHLR